MGPNKQTATRISHCENTSPACSEVLVQANLQGMVSLVAEAPPPLHAPALAGSIVPPKGKLGTVVYFVEGQKHTMDYAYSAEVANLKLNDKVRKLTVPLGKTLML